LKRLKDKNAKPKAEVDGYQMKKRIMMWGLLLCVPDIVATIGVDEVGDEIVN